jgi:hypothetical protein
MTLIGIAVIARHRRHSHVILRPCYYFYRIAMPKILSRLELERIRAKFRADLGRDLTAKECKYLGLASVVLPDDGTKLKPKLKTSNRRKS